MHNFSIDIKRTDRKKTVSFQVERGLVKVLVPKNLDKAKLDKIIKSKSKWIKNKLSKVDEQVFFKKLEDYKKILNDKKLYKQAWDDFCHNEKNTILLNKYFPIGHFRGMRRFGKIINPEIFLIPTNKNRLVKLNLIRCESHLELLQNVLEQGTGD